MAKRGHGTRLAKSILAGLLILLMGALTTSVGFAHAALIRSEPVDNSVSSDPPEEIRLWFNESISAEFSTARLLDINGQEIQLESLQTDPEDPYVLILNPPELPAGVFSVNWRVLSEADGHFTRGLMVFGVGEGVDTSTASKGAVASEIPWFEVLLRWVNFSTLAVLFGLLGISVLVLPRADMHPLETELVQARQRALVSARWLALAIFLIGFAWLFYQYTVLSGTLPEGVSPPRVIWQILVRTRWGGLWIARQVLVILLIGLIPRGKPSNGRMAVPLAISGLLLVVQALSGHAAAITPNTWVVVAADSLHLLSAAMWVGGLLGLAIAILPLARKSPASFTQLIQTSWGAFGAWAAVSVGLVIATGIYNTAKQTASPDALLATLYGQSLIFKVAFMLLAGFVGLLNSLSLHEGLADRVGRLLGRPPGWRPFKVRSLPRLIVVEAGLGLVVFLSVGFLTSTPPARGPEFAPSVNADLDSLSQSVDDLLVTFSAKPNQPGPNVFTIRATSRRRPPPAEILRVIVRFTFEGQDMGTVSADAEFQEEGVYRLGGNYLSLAGPWQVDVVVRRSGIEDSVARFDWHVSPGGPPRAVLISDQPWETPLTIFSALFFVAVLLVAIVGRWRAGRAAPVAMIWLALSLSLALPRISARAAPAGLSNPNEQAERRSQSENMLTVLVMLKDQAQLQTIDQEQGLDRQRLVIERLQAHARRTQSELIELLGDRWQQGSVAAVYPFWIFNGLAVTATPSVILELAQRDEVRNIVAERQFAAPTLETVAEDPLPNLEIIGATDLWALGISGQGVVVASMDTGVDANHPDLSTRWRGGENSWFDPYNQHPDFPVDRHGHGTAVMGVMVGGDLSGKDIGVAPGAKWVAVKIFNDQGAASNIAIHRGYQWLLDPDHNPNTADAPQIVNNSWVFLDPGCDLEFELDLQALRAAGIMPVFSAGNFGPEPSTSRSPANNPGAIAVGAVDQADEIVPSSSRGPSACTGVQDYYPQLVAPGKDIFSSTLAGAYSVTSGTSMAAPHVSGGVALLLSAFPGVSLAQQEESLRVSALDLGAAGADNDYGAGRLDLFQAYSWLLENYEPPIPPTPVPVFYGMERLYFPSIPN